MSDLVVANTTIRTDDAGRYFLNDLHRAAGGLEKDKPNRFLRLESTRDLIEELRKDEKWASDKINDLEPIKAVNSFTEEQGTYVCKELVYAYAMWISAKFHLQVIRAYDAMVTQKLNGEDMDGLRGRVDGLERAMRTLIDGLSHLIPRQEPSAGVSAPRYIADEGLFTVQEVAASIPMGPNVLFGRLRDEGIINRGGTPTQDYRNRGLFVLRARYGYARLYVTPVGAEWLRERYGVLAQPQKRRRDPEMSA